MPNTDAQPPSPARNNGVGSVEAWDAPTRIFHWLLAILVAAAWASYQFSETLGDPVLKWHRWIGLLILTLLVWRLLWGFFGSSTSRFSNFVPSPKQLISYASAIPSGTEPKYLGHNPLGTVMVLTLLTLLLTQATLGLFTVEHNDLTAGPLYRFLSEEGRKVATRWHRFLFETITLCLIGSHIVVNVFYAMFRREPLIKAMIVGRKPAITYTDAVSLGTIGRPMLRAVFLLAASASIVFGGIWAVGGKFLQMRLW